MAGSEEFGISVPLIFDPNEQGTNRTYLGNPIIQVEASGFTTTVTEQFVLHGQLSSSNKVPASLVVVHFSLHRDTSSKNRRFRHVTVGLTFTSSSDQPADDPAIRCFAPAQDGSIGVILTTVVRQQQHNASASAKVDAAPAPINLGFSYEWKNQADWDQHVFATVSAKASMSTRTRDREGNNVVEWTVTENDREKQIPDSYQLAVIIERKNNNPFIVQAKVDASVDVLYALKEATKRVIGVRRPFKTYDPDKRSETGKLEYPENAKIDGAELGSLVSGRELDKYSYVHIVEQVTPVSLYGGTQVPTSQRPQGDGGSGVSDAKITEASRLSLNLNINLGSGTAYGSVEEEADDS
ncbi:hypothetical protein B0T26DRAFT_257276 [Lasiosphaeria miniovina]|uniref:Uncharacterized protein n=1 Tax=Lasiosphaeria miniovina TaxID=1954250 RepID=A0AA40E180_9PEZI|nr:uncharacterized protein B0T26DRAFT_257276 [Lasiosphaeria miniovina]KAK0723275.1 hypothetical protein B0T26DRAFT_257276 [Lasiosphaeria miniovina]